MKVLRVPVIMFFIALILLFTPLITADTPVSGTINKNTTWSESGSPYIMGALTTVSGGFTLTIEPGCIIRMASNVTLEIQGRIIADGTPDKPIIFMKNTDSKWNYILFDSADPGCVLDSCRISGGSTLIRINNTTPGTPTTISNCLLYNASDECIYLSNSKAFINGCTMIANKDHGIKINSSTNVLKTPSIANCSIINKGATANAGIYLSMASYDNFQFLIENCRVKNFQTGININNNSGAENNTIRIISCDLKDNTQSVYFHNDYYSGNPTGSFQAEIRNCRIAYIHFDGSTVPLSHINARDNFWTLTMEKRSNKTDQISFTDDRSTDHFPNADLNNDGNTDLDDATVIMDYLVGNGTISDESLADADGDGDVDIRDASLVRSYSEGLLWKLPKAFLP
jgi:dockerin type I repeat protein